MYNGISWLNFLGTHESIIFKQIFSRTGTTYGLKNHLLKTRTLND